MKTKVYWTCSNAWEHEIGHTDVRLYTSFEELMQKRKCINDEEDKKYGYECKPVKLTIKAEYFDKVD